MTCPEEIKQMWEIVKESFKGTMSSAAFDMWYGGITPAEYLPEENTLVFETKSEFICKGLSAQHKPVLENAFYLLNDASFNMIDAIIRAFGAGLMHGMCTLLVGVGISFAKKRSKIFVVGTFALLSTAITYHGIYNMLVQSDFEVIGFLLPMATYIPFFVWRIKSIMKKQKD